jgi:hypothetical protein
MTLDRRTFIVSGAAVGGLTMLQLTETAGAQSEDAIEVTLDFGQLGDQAGPFTGTVLDPSGTLWDLEGTATPHPSGPPPGGPVTYTDLHVLPGAVLALDPTVDCDVTLVGRTLIEGTLRSRPNAGVRHTITLVCDEAAMVGGHDAWTTDDGLYFAHGGVLDVADPYGRIAWSRATGALTAGQETFTVADATGWQVGDLVAITPMVTRSYGSGFWNAYDEREILAISGNAITVAPLDHPHPVRLGYGAEVLNLTRQTVIRSDEGTRGHVMWHHSHAPQTIAGLKVEGLGVDGKLGRYPLHLHMNGTDMAGTTFTDCVAVACRERAFVPHTTHGVTMRRCVAHDVSGFAFWWDHQDLTDDLLWDACVASKLTTPVGVHARNLTAYMLGAGTNVSVQGCVAVGLANTSSGSTPAGGFAWPSGMGGVPSEWGFADNVSHNCQGKASGTWQNEMEPNRDIGPFDVWSCGGAGIDHGAYLNEYSYQDCRFDDMGGTPLVIHANGRGSGLAFERFAATGVGSGFACLITNHNLPPEAPTLIDGLTSDGGGIAVNDSPNGGGERTEATVRNLTAAGPEFSWAATCNPASVVTYETGTDVLELRPVTFTGDTTGMTWRSDWNCWAHQV